jgi:SAM-dependent methyltransferase
MHTGTAAAMLRADRALRENHVQYLCCPGCEGGLKLSEAHRAADGLIERGMLTCSRCRAGYPIVGYVPRFVPDEGYAGGFGLEWNMHDRTQYDRDSGVALSRTRFFEETGWPDRLEKEVLIEAGSGSGRFTEQAVTTGALVLSLDYSRAVDANYRSNGHHDNLLLVQGDLFRMPFPRDIADRLFCLGVLQHTPDPRAALRSLALHVRPGGEIVADIYAKTFARYVLGTKYWVRPVTSRMAPDRLYRLTSSYVDFMWPVAQRTRRIGRLGRVLNWRLLIGDYSDVIDDDAVLRDWARLDTFDMLAPRYDKPARAKTVRRWCSEMDLDWFVVRPGYNGLEIRAQRATA